MPITYDHIIPKIMESDSTPPKASRTPFKVLAGMLNKKEGGTVKEY